jgi:hypothetical protein
MSRDHQAWCWMVEPNKKPVTSLWPRPCHRHASMCDVTMSHVTDGTWLRAPLHMPCIDSLSASDVSCSAPVQKFLSGLDLSLCLNEKWPTLYVATKEGYLAEVSPNNRQCVVLYLSRNVSPHIITCLNMSQHVTTCLNMSQHVTTYLNVSKHVSTWLYKWFNMSKCVSTCLNMSTCVTKCPNVSQHVLMCLKVSTCFRWNWRCNVAGFARYIAARCSVSRFHHSAHRWCWLQALMAPRAYGARNATFPCCRSSCQM